jgi:hypothetical protein
MTKGNVTLEAGPLSLSTGLSPTGPKRLLCTEEGNWESHSTDLQRSLQL